MMPAPILGLLLDELTRPRVSRGPRRAACSLTLATARFGTGKMAGQGETGPAASAGVLGSRHRFGTESKVKGVKNLEHRVQRRIAIARQRLVEAFP